MDRTALAWAFILALLFSAIAGTQTINLADANPNWIDFSKPTINILSPINQKYNVTDIPLNFTVSEPVSKLTYSLDGQANVTITIRGNITLAGLSSGSHNLAVYAYDITGNIGASETVTFTISKEQDSFPTALVVAPIVAVFIAIVGLLSYFRKRKRQTEMRSLSETK